MVWQNKDLALAGQAFTALHDSGAGVKQTCYAGAVDVTTCASPAPLTSRSHTHTAYCGPLSLPQPAATRAFTASLPHE